MDERLDKWKNVGRHIRTLEEIVLAELGVERVFTIEHAVREFLQDISEGYTNHSLYVCSGGKGKGALGPRLLDPRVLLSI